MHEDTVTTCPVAHRAIESRVQDGGVRFMKPGSSAPAPQDDSRRSLIGQLIDGKYLVRSVLGEGGMGVVLEAEHTVIGRVVAVKVLHASQAVKAVAVKRFHQEARAAGAIGHPNICEVFDFGMLPDGSPYLVMERLHGRTLAARIQLEPGGLPLGDVVEVLVQMLSGLDAAHEQGILHRDIKPENVLLADRPGYGTIVKLLDFGVSKFMAGHAPEWLDETDLTKTGMVMGTPYYMSPEQARGDRNLDARVDVYACGVLLYEALTGQRPFVGPNYNSLLVSILRSTARPMRSLRPNIPVELERVQERAMQKNRDNRFQTAGEFIQALHQVRKTVGRPASPALDAPLPDIPIHVTEDTPSTSLPGDVSPSADPLTSLPGDVPPSADPSTTWESTVVSRNPPPETSPYDDELVPGAGEDPTQRMDAAEIQAVVEAVRKRGP